MDTSLLEVSRFTGWLVLIMGIALFVTEAFDMRKKEPAVRRKKARLALIFLEYGIFGFLIRDHILVVLGALVGIALVILLVWTIYNAFFRQ